MKKPDRGGNLAGLDTPKGLRDNGFWHLNPACNRGIVGSPCPDAVPNFFDREESTGEMHAAQNTTR